AAAVAGGRLRGRSAGHEAYAIPINKALQIAKQLEANPRSTTPSTTPSSPQQQPQQSSNRAVMGVYTTTASQGGAEVVDVAALSPADDAGLQPGDVIVAVDRTSVSSAEQLSSTLASHGPGDKVV